ncbi:efflux RND transporter periplasmic adaptor subunit [Thioalkalivibrio sp. XN8]|uniref:efflux RND transporter periplasmic adaptor subunit n=1 Tax=Thioalkalivibrio sp. XN8 TaxID=2712863 RepID=UPI0013ECAF63|nr:efflux RND transporter periplasmic adaptor subunit [Thioalkalivibrio sp. XN8]NGP52354.1 efflux RND transporter periplasmic adaptor subunit [Thioalkalivibrio sp. XN8]
MNTLTSPGAGLRRAMLAPIGLLGLALALTACEQQPPAAPRAPVPVVVQQVEARTVPVVTSRVAQTESSRQVEVVARVSGFLEAITYTEGGLIEAGEVMFEMDRKPLEAQLDMAQGEVEASQARLATAEANLERTRPLAAADALSQADLDRAIGEQQAAKAALYTARARLRQAELNLGYATIRSPVTGMAGAAQQREGTFLNAQGASANLAYVAQLDPIWVNFSVSQNEAARREQREREGLYVSPENDRYQVEVVLSGGRVFPHEGELDFADPSYDRRTGTFTVRAVVPNPDLALRPGMFVTARLKGARRPDAIVLPQRAVQKSADGHVVWLVNAQQVAELRPVVVGDWIGPDWLIEHGLNGGETLITDGFQRLAPGVPVRPVPALPADAAAGE